jgi:hypothetical protein
MRKQWLIAVVAALAVTTAAFVRAQDAEPDSAAQETAAAPAEAEAGGDITQPIHFPHNLHAGQYQIACQYCHFSAERSVDAGIPPVSTCMGCHRLVPGTTDAQKTEIAKISEFFNAGQQIPWTRIYKVADHAHFPHMRHVNAKTASFPSGISCQTCHGEVQEMGVLTSRSDVWKGDNMGWCVSCHVKEEVSRDCTVCHY